MLYAVCLCGCALRDVLHALPHFCLVQTRILVTHGLSFLPQCDLIVVLDEGNIIEVGTYKELIENDEHFAEFMRTYAGPEENQEDVFDGSEYSFVNL